MIPAPPFRFRRVIWGYLPISTNRAHLVIASLGFHSYTCRKYGSVQKGAPSRKFRQTIKIECTRYFLFERSRQSIANNWLYANRKSRPSYRPPETPPTVSCVLIFGGGTYSFSEYLRLGGSGSLAKLSMIRPDLRIITALKHAPTSPWLWGWA